MKKKRNTNKPLEALAPNYGLCMVSKRISVDGYAVGYMYREDPEDEADSGWRFFSGDESDDYIENGRNFQLVDVNKIANLDTSIIAYLDAPPGSVFDRVDGTDDFINSSD